MKRISLAAFAVLAVLMATPARSPTRGPAPTTPARPVNDAASRQAIEYNIDQEFYIHWGERSYAKEAQRIPRACWNYPDRPLLGIYASIDLNGQRRKVGYDAVIVNPLEGVDEVGLHNRPGGSRGISGGVMGVDLPDDLRDLPPGTYRLHLEMRNENSPPRQKCDILLLAEEYVLRKGTPADLSPKPTFAVPTPEPSASQLLLPGRMIEATAHTVDAGSSGYSLGSESLNQSIQNLRASIDESRGNVCFAFDFEEWKSEFWGGVGGGLHILVRLFGQRGKYLNHIETSEAFGSRHKAAQYDADALRMMKFQTLKRRGNMVCYGVNARDASFVKSIEVGFLSRPVGQ